ncbi:MAG: histidine phosphatase family protein [Mycobacteriales bacterium]
MTDRGGSEVAVVAPERSIAALICLALGAPAAAITRIALDPGGVCIVDWNADGTATLRAIRPPSGP